MSAVTQLLRATPTGTRRLLSRSFEQLLDEIAHRGSWLGGGSVAAASLALAASLLEKLLPQPVGRRRMRRLRRECVRLIDGDARAFAQVIAATRQRDRTILRRRLKAATAIPLRIRRHAATAKHLCQAAGRSVPPRLQSDLRCVTALAQASAMAAGILAATNRAWLRQVRLRAARGQAGRRGGGRASADGR
jgi:formiminotetrahydrofolate cyclodeaminase